jgi:hypothetical protein
MVLLPWHGREGNDCLAEEGPARSDWLCSALGLGLELSEGKREQGKMDDRLVEVEEAEA